jgi:uncharacterized membrane protein
MQDFWLLFSDVIGVVGVILLLTAYYCLNTNRTSAFSFKYQLVNFIGALLILISLFFKWNTAAAIIEVAWMLISIVGMRRALRNKIN